MKATRIEFNLVEHFSSIDPTLGGRYYRPGPYACS